MSTYSLCFRGMSLFLLASLAQFPWHGVLSGPIRTRPSVSAAFQVSCSECPAAQDGSSRNLHPLAQPHPPRTMRRSHHIRGHGQSYKWDTDTHEATTGMFSEAPAWNVQERMYAGCNNSGKSHLIFLRKWSNSQKVLFIMSYWGATTCDRSRSSLLTQVTVWIKLRRHFTPFGPLWSHFTHKDRETMGHNMLREKVY